MNQCKTYRSQAKASYLFFLGFALLMYFAETGFTYNNELVWGVVYWILIPIPLVGIFCKQVTETEDSFKVTYMLGLLNKEFNKNKMLASHSDKTLIAPGPFIVSNWHIKFQDENKSCIIYFCGTSNFERLKIRIEELSNRIGKQQL